MKTPDNKEPSDKRQDKKDDKKTDHENCVWRVGKYCYHAYKVRDECNDGELPCPKEDGCNKKASQ